MSALVDEKCQTVSMVNSKLFSALLFLSMYLPTNLSQLAPSNTLRKKFLSAPSLIAVPNSSPIERQTKYTSTLVGLLTH